jgi:hypothetical protein
MIQPGDFSGCRVKAGKIVTFEGVAGVAGQTQILNIIRTAVFYWDDVIDMKGDSLAD